MIMQICSWPTISRFAKCSITGDRAFAGEMRQSAEASMRCNAITTRSAG